MNDDANPSGIDRKDRRTVEKRLRLRPAVIHEIVREEGEEELSRTVGALWWSGLAAGLSVGFSMLVAGLLKAGLPDTGWADILIAGGYTSGFLIVILGRQQLFTENTITALLPVINDFRLGNVLSMLRLWGIVLAANLAGAGIFAAGTIMMPVGDTAAMAAFSELGHHLLDLGISGNFTGGIGAGWLIAALVWILPSVPHGRFITVFFITWIIGIAGFSHIIVGSVEVFFLGLTNQASLGHILIDFMLPTFAGNVFGGSALFALITYAQVREEVDPDT